MSWMEYRTLWVGVSAAGILRLYPEGVETKNGGQWGSVPHRCVPPEGITLGTQCAVIINQNLPAGGNAGPHLAHAKCSQHRATGGDVVLHEGLECLNDAMNCLRRLKSEAVGELFVRRGVFGLRLIL